MLQAVFLDLDGTLIDPKPGITGAIQHALSEMGMADIPDRDDLEWCIGPSLWDSFQTLLGEGADIDAAVGYYREVYTDTGLFEAKVYEGVPAMLADLRATGAKLWIATSKPHIYAQTIIDHFGITPLVEGLFGSELDGSNTDKTALLAHALAETGFDPARVIMLGDRRFDMIGARDNDIASIGALWGYGEPDELHLAEADGLAGAPSEVLEIAQDLLGVEV